MCTPKQKRSFNVILMSLVNHRGWIEGEENTDPRCLNPHWEFRKKNWRALVYYKDQTVAFTRRKKNQQG